MTTEIKKKNWFRRHWIVSIILGLFVLGIIGAMFSDTSSDSNTQTTNNQPPAKEYIDKDIYDLWFDFISRDSPYTDLQKEENFKQYKNKWIKSSGEVEKIDEVGFGSSNIVVGIASPEEFSFSRAASLYFDESYKNQLINYGVRDEISFEGRIEQYSGLVGIVVKDVELR